jgi:hypothetical protein
MARAKHVLSPSAMLRINSVEGTQSMPSKNKNANSKLRNPKFETIPKVQKSESSKPARFGFRNWNVLVRADKVIR